MMENLLETFSDECKVWIYLANRDFIESEANSINHMLHDFSTIWTSHGHQVYGKALLFENRFIIFLADESKSGVSGCSIDKTVAIVREITTTYKVNLMDRSLVAIRRNDKLEVLSLASLQEQIKQNIIAANVRIYNTLVQNKAELLKWLTPYNESKFVNVTPIETIQFSLL